MSIVDRSAPHGKETDNANHKSRPALASLMANLVAPSVMTVRMVMCLYQRLIYYTP